MPQREFAIPAFSLATRKRQLAIEQNRLQAGRLWTTLSKNRLDALIGFGDGGILHPAGLHILRIFELVRFYCWSSVCSKARACFNDLDSIQWRLEPIVQHTKFCDSASPRVFFSAVRTTLSPLGLPFLSSLGPRALTEEASLTFSSSAFWAPRVL